MRTFVNAIEGVTLDERLKKLCKQFVCTKKVNERFVCIMRTIVNNSSHVNSPSSTRSEAMVPVAYFEGEGGEAG